MKRSGCFWSCEVAVQRKSENFNGAVGGWHLQTCLLACSQYDKVRLCCLAPPKTKYFLFLSSLGWSSLYKSCVCPFVSAQIQLSHRNGLIAHYLWFSRSLVILKSEIKTEMVHNNDSDLLRPIKSFKKLPLKCSRGATHIYTHTLSHPVDPVLLRSGGKHCDGIIHSEAEILPWSMEPSTVKFTVATSAPAVYNVAGLSCANWHYSVHKSP